MERGTTAVERLEGGTTSIQQPKLDEASAILEDLSGQSFAGTEEAATDSALKSLTVPETRVGLPAVAPCELSTARLRSSDVTASYGRASFA